MKVVVMPGPVVCFDCGNVMKPDVVNQKQEVVMGVTCLNPQCEHSGKMHLFPLGGMEIEPLPQSPIIQLQ